jgi:hypothetical protein
MMFFRNEERTGGHPTTCALQREEQKKTRQLLTPLRRSTAVNKHNELIFPKKTQSKYDSGA